MLYGIIVTFQRPQDFRRTLGAICRQTRRPERLLVVDNDPCRANEEACAEASEEDMRVEYYPSARNVGPAGGFELGMRRILPFASDEDWVVLFDDDDPPHRDDLLGEMLRFARMMRAQDPRTGGVGMFGFRVSEKLGRPVRPHVAELDGPVRVDAVGNGRSAMYLVEAIRRVGPFDPALFFGFEELEFGLRLRSAGYKIYANGDVWRHWTSTQGDAPDDKRHVRLRRSTWRHYYTVRNLIWVQKRYGWFFGAAFTTAIVALAKPILNLALSPRLAMETLGSSIRAVRDAWSGRLGVRPVVNGMNHGHGTNGLRIEDPCDRMGEDWPQQ